MPKSIFFLVFTLFSFFSLGQENVEWVVGYDAETETISFHAKIEEGWHLYSQHVNEDIGPVPTSFEFNENKKKFKLVGETIEPTPISEYDLNFEGEVSFFEHSVTFTQKVKAKSPVEVSGKITFMVCNKEMCLPPVDVDFNIMIDKDEK